MPSQAHSDGRHARRSASRGKIVRAFKALVQEGDAAPAASTVAARAGVGLRTVYRCFDDMGSLYRELIQLLHDEFVPRAVLDLDTPDRSLRLARLLERRAELFAELEPFLLASEARRDINAELARDYDFLLEIERKRLAFAINPDTALPADVFEALSAIASFSFWRRLRVEQGLDPAQAGRVLTLTGLATLAAERALPPIPAAFCVDETATPNAR